ncbi:hypothetical protein DEO72_LG1g2379 [Vigna unguiculata]|uniref:Uncharacterized protein n=1 Tax=Vigna unguiculata TaxID=3917 RepID=A0A4D6KQF3_VIGUN|nr:hypothetical protein DEO72_LG1g2379 [Vigna unguiculata]
MLRTPDIDLVERKPKGGGQPKGAGKAAVRGELNGTICLIQCHFRFGKQGRWVITGGTLQLSSLSEGEPGGGTLYRQATQMNEGILGYFYELPGGNKFPPGDASLLTRFSGSMLFGRFLIGEKDGKSAGIWEVPELMHRLAASFAPPGDVGDNVEGVLFVIERVLRVSGSLV